MAGKPIRLGKAAGELNVGVSTLVEFLHSKGVTIDANPNTKLEGEHFEILQKQFAADQTLKEQSKLTAVKREKRETISIRDSKSSTDTPRVEDEDEVDHDVIERIKSVAPVNQAVKKEEVANDSNVTETSAKVEEVVEKTVEPHTLGEGDVQVQIVGKIDLDKLNTKTRPDKKKFEKPKKTPYTPPKPTPAPAEKVEAKVESKEEEKPKEEEPIVPKEIETIRVERKVLSGPTVLGKIELPVSKPKTAAGGKPGAPGQSQNDRKKRKRIKKIDPTKAGQPGTNAPGTPSQGGQNRPGGQGGQNRPVSPNYKGGQNNANKGKFVKPEINERDIQKEIKDTLARLSNKGSKSKASKNRKVKRDVNAQRRQDELDQQELEASILKLTEFVTVSELATMMSVSPTQVISACMSLGIFASINQRLDAETIQIIADEFGFEAEFVSADVQEAIPQVEDREEDLIARPPIITVMGHVDHGKTSLLDKLRNANVTEGEAGGITQHIGAYSLTLKDGRKMTFLDTPGHEAFTAMRARGAQVTDVAIIIVAADDDVMPQTKEAISHAQAANVPMVFAINKIDKPGANPEKIREQLSQMNILVEDWGGKYQCQEISAKQNLNIDALLEKVILES